MSTPPNLPTYPRFCYTYEKLGLIRQPRATTVAVLLYYGQAIHEKKFNELSQ